MNIKRFSPTFIVGLLFMACLTLAGCGGAGYGGGLAQSIVHENPDDKCMDTYSSAKVKGKSTTIDNTTISFPVDWKYARSQQEDYNGANWKGDKDDAVRGVGLCFGEDGQGAKDWENAWSVNMRWDYVGITGVDPKKASTDANYTNYSKNAGIQVGGTTEYATTWDTAHGAYDAKTAGKVQSQLLKQAKILVYNPDNNKACICTAGFEKEDGTWNNNWGPNNLARFMGASPKVMKELDIHSPSQQNGAGTVVECYFVSEDAELGMSSLEDNGITATSTVSSGNKCKDSSAYVDNSSIASLAVSAAYDPAQPKCAGHVMRDDLDGQKGHPTTELAIKLRKLATGDNYTIDCGKFVASIMRCTVDRNYIAGGTTEQHNYCRDHPELYDTIQNDDGVPFATIDEAMDKLQPGDVCIKPGTGAGGHTMIYVGFDAIHEAFPYINDKTYVWVEASLDEHGPFITNRKFNTTYTIYRFKDLSQANPVDGVDSVL